MFFYVKYIDYEDFQKTEDLESLASELTNVFPTKNKELLVNPDCFIGIIMDYVFDAAGIDEDIRSDFDFSNVKGKTLNVHLYPPNQNSLDIFTEKATYYIVYCDKERDRVRPLLNISTKEYVTFIDNERRKSSLKKTRSHSKSSRPSLTKKGSLSIKSLKSSGSTLKSKSRGLME